MRAGSSSSTAAPASSTAAPASSTVAPASSTAAPAAKSPCATYAPTPKVTCGTFPCPSRFQPRPGVIPCGNQIDILASSYGPKCSTQLCCSPLPTTVTTTPATTVTTTPIPTCASFRCPAPWQRNTAAGMMGCGAGKCSPKVCCSLIATTVTTTPCQTTTVTTTPPLTCSSSGFSCPSGTKPAARISACMGKCNADQCCNKISKIAPCTTVTVTPVPNCASAGFSCPWGSKAKPGSPVWCVGNCNAQQCCNVIMTTLTATPVPNPCTTVTATPSPFALFSSVQMGPRAQAAQSNAAQLYSVAAEDSVRVWTSREAEHDSPSFAAAFFGVGLFAFFAVGFAARSRSRPTREIHHIHSPFSDDESSLESGPLE